MSARRSFLIPEVIQSSGMDCGPAALAAIMAGFGIPASYGRLREACQTDVDGTSIDTLEDVACMLGLDAEQILVPRDHVLLPEAECLPAIAVTVLPGGLTHFVVLWRRVGPYVQVMDPGIGRRWVKVDGFVDGLFPFAQPLPAEDWREWAADEDFLAPLGARGAALGIPAGARAALQEAALADASWEGLARLDAAVRAVAELVSVGAVARGGEAQRLVEGLVGGTGSLPPRWWTAQALGEDEDGTAYVGMQGTVLLRIRGPRGEDAEGGNAREALPPDLEIALSEPDPTPVAALGSFMGGEARGHARWLSVAVAASALGAVVEAVLFRGLLDLTQVLSSAPQRLGALVAVLVFGVALLMLELPISLGAARLGRHLELGMRVAFMRKIPRLSDRYFASRQISDMAERAHSVHTLRQLPGIALGTLRALASLGVTAAGMIWLAPQAWLSTLAAAAVCVALPLVSFQVVAERDLRMRTQTGALTRAVLDALLGLSAVRSHGAARSVRREHEKLLAAWTESGLDLQRANVAIEGVQATVGLLLAVGLVVAHLGHSGGVGGGLLLAFWALQLPGQGEALAGAVRQLPGLRSATLRLAEPLGAPEAPEATGGGALPAGPLGLRLDDVSVVAGGHAILSGIDLEVAPGEHVAIVGPSGAGKSSLVGLLLGWHRAATGRVEVGGASLDAAGLAAVRRRVAWVDPSVHLWNASLLENLLYGAGGVPEDVDAVLEAAELVGVAEGLPDGLAGGLGEGGGLLSGGQGQRVRVGRAMARRDVGLVILDEPFRGLDAETRRRLLDRARSRWSGATLLCITHDLAHAASFDRVVVIADGAVAEDGPPAALAAEEDGVWSRLVAAEADVRQSLWGDPAWRRARLRGGRLQEAGEAP